MSEEKAGGYISEIKFKCGTSVEIQRDSIVVFVGPNNAGKSQSLKDIYSLSSQKCSGVILDDIVIKKSAVPISSLLNKVAFSADNGSYKTYSFLGGQSTFTEYTERQFLTGPYFDDLCDLFVANLDTSARLTICNAANNISRDAAKQHPIHYAAFDGEYRKWLSDSFKKAFGVEVTPNAQYGAKIPLCIGALVKLGDQYEDEQTRQEAYAKVLESYNQVHNQGDGIRSFTGILLYLMLDYFCTYLIDEPESFLHPPQARIMGQIIGETLSDQQQCFMSTHSEEIIKGLLEACPRRIKIIRITREEDINSFSILDNTTFGEVWNDPLLKYSNIMSSLFHKSVVLCESDSDCKIYSIIESHLKQFIGKYSETLFIHCGGKHRMGKVSKALLALNVDVKLIPDIDVMNDETVFKGIVDSFGINWASIQRDYNTVVSNLHSTKEKVSRNDAKTSITRIIDGATSPDLTSSELKDIRSSISIISKWDVIKATGISGLPAGDATTAFSRMDQILREHGIYIVPVGELECFIKEVGGHGPEWANRVLEAYPNLDDVVYAKVKEFISTLNL